MTAWSWVVRGRQILPATRTLIMGILNVTPDSFSNGGLYRSVDDAVGAGLQMLDEGADIVDIGGESSRPDRSGPVSVDVELSRIMPVLEALRSKAPQALISVDTYKAEVAEKALQAGADIINDIYALRFAPSIANLVAREGGGLILMHMQGTPETMQENPRYENLVVDIKNELRQAIEQALARGVPEDAIVVDPGFGFGKTVEHNVELLANLEYFRLLQRPICIGVSRKRFLGALTGGLGVQEREEATIAAQTIAVLHGASIVRTHNVRAARRALAVADAVVKRL
ncbi:MAG: dihydropteroate synthase [Candidatus Sumerlaeaceae bacterium]|nr:dihydropteroate synthase [Candidatus Sumerlaeaceae bacterium]